MAEIQTRSQNVANLIKRQQTPIGNKLLSQDIVIKHFERAAEITRLHSNEVKKILPFTFSSDKYTRKRETLLDFTAKIHPTFEILESKKAEAMAFPHGEIFVTRRLIEAFDLPDEGYNSALVGVFIHELLHVRDGHALEQWAMADGRNQLVRSRAIGTLANITSLLLFLSTKYDIDYGESFESSELLSGLSEYAADFGTLMLLNENGFDTRAYINFLDEVHRFMTSRGTILSEPFSWVNGRLECLNALFNANSYRNYPSVIIGSDGNGNGVSYTLDRDNPMTYRRGILTFEGPVIVADETQWLMFQIFTRCAVGRVFKNNNVKNRFLQVPSFDLFIFEQYVSRRLT